MGYEKFVQKIKQKKITKRILCNSETSKIILKTKSKYLYTEMDPQLIKMNFKRIIHSFKNIIYW